MKTIRTRVVGAFSLILVILAALGVNAYIANRAIGVEARRVRVAADAGVSHSEFLVHLRSTLEHAKLFAASEDAIDRESLGAAVDALDATSAALGAADPVGASSTALRREKDAYARSLAGIIGLITARQRQSSDLIEALTSVQVFVAAIAQRTREDQPQAAAAIALMEGVTSSGISALRYRASRDPSDIEASKRWSAEARDAVRRLAATDAQDDDRLRKLMAGLAKPLAKYDDALLGVEAATDAFAAAKPEWDAASRTVLEDGIRARVADAAAQREAADRMLASVRVAGTFDLAATVAAIAAGLTLALLLVRNIVHPLVAMTRAMHRLAGGALDTPIPCGGRRDEIGAMAQALMVFRDGLTAVAAMSAGKEEERIAKHRRIEALEALNRAFEVDFGGFTSSLADAASRMTSSAKTLMDSSAQTTERCAAAGADADVASAGVRAVATATVDVAARVEDIGRRVSTSAHEAVGAAARAHEADAAVSELQSGAHRIGEVVGLRKGRSRCRVDRQGGSDGARRGRPSGGAGPGHEGARGPLPR